MLLQSLSAFELRVVQAFRPASGHSSDHFDDGLTAFDVAFAVIEDSVRRKCRYVELGVMKIEREQIPRLEILNDFLIVPSLFLSPTEH